MFIFLGKAEVVLRYRYRFLFFCYKTIWYTRFLIKVLNQVCDHVFQGLYFSPHQFAYLCISIRGVSFFETNHPISVNLINLLLAYFEIKSEYFGKLLFIAYHIYIYIYIYIYISCCFLWLFQILKVSSLVLKC